MTVSEFEKFRAEFDAECATVLFSKMKDYAADADAHRNFNQSAEAAGVSPLTVWAIFLKKHLDAIFTYVREGRVASEPVRQRVLDARNYLDLGLALMTPIPVSPNLDEIRGRLRALRANLGDRTEAQLGDAR